MIECCMDDWYWRKAAVPTVRRFFQELNEEPTYRCRGRSSQDEPNQPMRLVGPGQVLLPFLEPRVLTQSRSGARFQSRFNSAGRHKRHLRGGSFHKVRQLPRARAQVRVPDSMERSRGWARDRR